MSVRLYVGNLPKEPVDRDELQAIFAEASPSVSTKVIKDRKTGKCRGFGFVTVPNDELAEQIIEKFNGHVFKDSALKIEKAQPKSKSANEEEPRSSGGGSTPGRRPGGKKAKRSSSPTPDSGSVQPDPRWADDLAKLKERLSAQPNNS
ncbi:RNA recognition motif domain-containing protein [Coleofasciculus sp. F4-SAH-05]|jgi:RNA recognition motif-containing protein|uniref:RNA recognition motif domain-containing protein n=1 Tax=Coleofasciculus TaxID=669368 RepID=UPI0032F52504